MLLTNGWLENKITPIIILSCNTISACNGGYSKRLISKSLTYAFFLLFDILSLRFTHDKILLTSATTCLSDIVFFSSSSSFFSSSYDYPACIYTMWCIFKNHPFLRICGNILSVRIKPICSLQNTLSSSICFKRTSITKALS